MASVAFGDGRHAALPWLQETPDPMTTASWDTCEELNPATAQSLGIKDNDVVKIISPHGQIEAIAYLYPGIRPDVVAVPIGQGHTESGRWAKGRGANVLSLLAPHIAAGSGHLAWAATRVQLEKTGQQQVLPVLESKVGVARAHEKGETPG